MSPRSAHIPKAANSRTDFGRRRGCSATCTSTLVPSVSFTSSSGLKTPSSYLAAIVMTFALAIQGYQDGPPGAPHSFTVPQRSGGKTGGNGDRFGRHSVDPVD